eukprot:5775506-Heterocapsa_arctica.AAC.1
MHLVGEFKLLGGIIAMNGSISAETGHRASSAMSSYGPLAGMIFGSESIPTALKMALLRSLVQSRLLYIVHTLTMTP